MLVRLINDAPNDPYHRQSRMEKILRRKYADDIIQPNNPRFDLLYPQLRREEIERAEKEEKEKWHQRQIK